MGLGMPEKRRQERGKLGFRHLAGRHRKFLVTDLAKAGHIAVDADIERWVGQDQIGGLAVEQAGVIRLAARVSAQQPMRTQNPKVALSRNRGLNDRRNVDPPDPVRPASSRTPRPGSYRSRPAKSR